MAINLRENQYRGVNAHLHSYLQQMGEWESFHSEHITHLREALQAILPAGYRARTERSLQLNTFQSSSEPEYLSAIMIVDVKGDKRAGVPVTRIELLSPANKPRGSHASQYRDNRNRMVESGIHMVEIDYLYESRFPAHIPSYPDRQEGATAYTIAVYVVASKVDESMVHLYLLWCRCINPIDSRTVGQRLGFVESVSILQPYIPRQYGVWRRFGRLRRAAAGV